MKMFLCTFLIFLCISCLATSLDGETSYTSPKAFASFNLFGPAIGVVTGYGEYVMRDHIGIFLQPSYFDIKIGIWRGLFDFMFLDGSSQQELIQSEADLEKVWKVLYAHMYGLKTGVVIFLAEGGEGFFIKPSIGYTAGKAGADFDRISNPDLRKNVEKIVSFNRIDIPLKIFDSDLSFGYRWLTPRGKSAIELSIKLGYEVARADYWEMLSCFVPAIERRVVERGFTWGVGFKILFPIY